ncbi:MAG: cation:proton antiporter [Gammaproteobacteria bacterium SHHR-1]|uniref:cation:proton antiporter domain-containing protein n=1 Tax=Magnetovirga frankeli TaxID=947516 RepID=UPI00129391BB|nr:cation:proton antiporter [gamma proteobacterium SS-5]
MELHSFVISAVLLLSAASLAVALFKQLGLGSVLGLLVAGVIVGPHSPGPVAIANVEAVRHFTELGVVLLLFLIGLEMKPHRLWALRREVFGLGSLQILLTGLVIAVYAQQYYPAWPVALLIGVTLALSSTAFVMQILQERGDITSRHGSSAFAVLLMQDLAIVPLLAMVPLLSDHSAPDSLPLGQQLALVLGMLLVVWIFGRYLVRMALERLARSNNREGFSLVVFLAVFLAAAAMHEAGLSMALGAFLMGMLLSESRFSYQIQALVEPYKGLLMSLFFVAVGMSIDLEAVANAPGRFAEHVLALIAIKLVVMFLLGLAFGLGRAVATRVAFMLAQSGEFGFVLFGSALALGVISDELFVVAVAAISVSMLLTPLLIRIGDGLAMRIDRKYVANQDKAEPYSFSEGDAQDQRRVIIAGYGRVGHTVATILEDSAVAYVCFDTNPNHVAAGKADSRPVYYGDIGDFELLSALHLQHSSLVVLTIDHSPTALRAVSHIRSINPSIPIIARARDLQTSTALLDAGATKAYPETLESSLRLSAEALQMIGISSGSVETLVQDVRASDYKQVLKGENEPH